MLIQLSGRSRTRRPRHRDGLGECDCLGELAGLPDRYYIHILCRAVNEAKEQHAATADNEKLYGRVLGGQICPEEVQGLNKSVNTEAHGSLVKGAWTYMSSIYAMLSI